MDIESMNEEQRIEAIAAHYREIIKLLGEDPDRQGLAKTPQRAARAMVYATGGYRQNAEEIVNGAIFDHDGRGIVAVNGIEFYSLCEHHILPFFGHADVAYIPNGRIIGISKLARLVDMIARRLQVQEVMTRRIAEAVAETTGAEDVIVRVSAGHLCMKMRGVEKQDSETVTIEALGRFNSDPLLREDFYRACR